MVMHVSAHAPLHSSQEEPPQQEIPFVLTLVLLLMNIYMLILSNAQLIAPPLIISKSGMEAKLVSDTALVSCTTSLLLILPQPESANLHVQVDTTLMQLQDIAQLVQIVFV